MKILLLGEYSRLHNSLKEGLMAQGHEVFLVGYGDYFKDYPVDLKLNFKYQSGARKLTRKFVNKVFNIDLHSRNIQKFFNENLALFSGYDVVQLINENTFQTVVKTEIELLDYIFKNNKNVFLLSCGTDYTSVNYAFDNKLKYSILNPLNDNKVSEKNYLPILHKISDEQKVLHDFIFERIKGVIASDIDYHLPLLDNPKYIGLVPNPINIDNLRVSSLDISGKIKIFHGINEMNYFKKGHDIFEQALAIIQQKHADKVEVITVRSMPYRNYINAYNSSHILLDQVYSYDQGYNALEAMAKGKVVFSGAECEWLDYYDIEKDTVLINAQPKVNNIVEKLEWLILKPNEILKISNNARKFVEKHHNYLVSSKNYLEIWQNFSD